MYFFCERQTNALSKFLHIIFINLINVMLKSASVKYNLWIYLLLITLMIIKWWFLSIGEADISKLMIIIYLNFYVTGIYITRPSRAHKSEAPIRTAEASDPSTRSLHPPIRRRFRIALWIFICVSMCCNIVKIRERNFQLSSGLFVTPI